MHLYLYKHDLKGGISDELGNLVMMAKLSLEREQPHRDASAVLQEAELRVFNCAGRQCGGERKISF